MNRKDGNLLTLIGTAFLKNGVQVGPESLGCSHLIALYFSASWSHLCKKFTGHLELAYCQINDKKQLFEVVFVPGCKEIADNAKYQTAMPWLCIPMEDSRTEMLKEKFRICRYPTLVLLSRDGTIECEDAYESALLEEAAFFRPFIPSSIYASARDVTSMPGYQKRVPALQPPPAMVVPVVKSRTVGRVSSDNENFDHHKGFVKKLLETGHEVRVSWIEVWTAQYVRGVTIGFNIKAPDGTVSDKVEANVGTHTHEDEKKEKLVLADDEYIVKVWGQASSVIDQIIFTTNKGRKAEGGKRSGEDFEISVPPGTRFLCLGGGIDKVLRCFNCYFFKEGSA